MKYGLLFWEFQNKTSDFSSLLRSHSWIININERNRSERRILIQQCSTEAKDGHSNSYFFHAPSCILKIPINNPVDGLEFLIPFLSHAPFLCFSCYLIKQKHHKPSLRIEHQQDIFLILVIYCRSVIYGSTLTFVEWWRTVKRIRQLFTLMKPGPMLVMVRIVHGWRRMIWLVEPLVV